MSFKFANLAHVLATVAGDVVKGARAVESALVKVKGQEQLVEALTGVVDPMAVPIERAAFYLLGKAAAAAHDAGAAAVSSGLNITLDAAEVADLKDIIAYLRSHPMAQSAQIAGK
jgi:hypothetical protein